MLQCSSNDFLPTNEFLEESKLGANVNHRTFCPFENEHGSVQWRQVLRLATGRRWMRLIRE